MNRLEKLCRPLILQVCESCNCARAGAQIDGDKLKNDIMNSLEEIRHQCESDALLAHDFQKVEQPLIFFIDYVIKEGNFPFSKAWVPIARSHQELSGDEKFFDLLQRNLDDPEAGDALQVFQLLMGLGFDGCYKNNKDFVERRMKLCAVRSHVTSGITGKDLASFAGEGSGSPKRYRFHYHSNMSWYVLLFCVFLALAGLAWNFYRFEKMADEYYSYFKSVYKKVTQDVSLPMDSMDKKVINPVIEVVK